MLTTEWAVLSRLRDNQLHRSSTYGNQSVYSREDKNLPARKENIRDINSRYLGSRHTVYLSNNPSPVAAMK